MSLIYRGHTYQRTSSSVETGLTSVKMIYRGQTFEYTPRPIAPRPNISEMKNFDPAKLQRLIYRGQVFKCIPPQPEVYRKPKAMNWRYEMIARGAMA